MWKLSKEEFDSYFGDDVAKPYKFVNNAYGYVNHDVLLYKEEHENYTVFYQCIGKDGKPIDSKIYYINQDKYVKLFMGVSDNKIKIPIKHLFLFSDNIFEEIRLIKEESDKQSVQEAIISTTNSKLILEIATKIACSYVRNEKYSDVPAMIAEDSVKLAKELIKLSYK